MGTHSDGKPVSRYGFDGPYWYTKKERERDELDANRDKHIELFNEFRKNMDSQ